MSINSSVSCRKMNGCIWKKLNKAMQGRRKAYTNQGGQSWNRATSHKFIQSIDAAEEGGSCGWLVNDEHRKPNCRMKTLGVEGKPHLCLFAVEDISPGEEIAYDYGNSEWPRRVKVQMAGQQRTDSGAKSTEMVPGTTCAPEKAGPGQEQTWALPLSSSSMDELLNDSGCAAPSAEEPSGAMQSHLTTEIDAINSRKCLQTMAEN
ncbi:hypothetical protein GJAV_G00060120 [Gymnothorax javanicus]|nr:hypothetical protein GJAV_G00060120 [Gymnothorax javanicus]